MLDVPVTLMMVLFELDVIPKPWLAFETPMALITVLLCENEAM